MMIGFWTALGIVVTVLLTCMLLLAIGFVTAPNGRETADGFEREEG